MPVQKQLVPVQFGGGINTKVDPHQLQAGQLLDLQNGQFTKQGQINKRYGYDILTRNIEGGGTITNGVEIASFKNELILFDGTSIYSYVPTTGNWSSRGTAISITTEAKAILRTSQAQQLNPDFAYLSGIEVYAWEDSRGGVHYSVLDSTTKAYAVSDQVVSTNAQQPKCIAFNGLIYIFYSDGQNTLYYVTVNPLNPTVLTPAVIVVSDGFNGLNGYPYDISVINRTNGNSVTSRMYIAYLSSSVVSGAIRVTYIDTNQLVFPPVTINHVPGQAINPGFHGAINVVGDASSNVWITWANGMDVRILAGAYDLSGPVGPQSLLVDTVDCRVLSVIPGSSSPLITPANGMIIFYEVQGATPQKQQLRYTTVNLQGTFGLDASLRSVGIASKAFTYNNNIYINVAHQSNLQATDFTLYIPSASLQAAVIIAKVTPSVGGGLQTNGMAPEIPQLATGTFKFANLEAGKIISEANTVFTLLGVNSTKLSFTPSTNFVNTVQSNTLLIVGGILQSYDGTVTTETGFHLFPEGITATPAGVDGFLSTGTYQYAVTYEWMDNNGQIYRSAPSIPVTTVVTANNHVTITGPSLCLTQKSKVSIVIYRTTANGTIFRRVSSSIAPLLNDPTTDTWTFTDTLSDLSQAANEILYTTGNILANIAPPANSIITTYNNRVFLAGLSDKLLMWYSQTVVDNSNSNTIPPQFCQELTVSCDPRGGDITALGLLNSALIIFKDKEIFALQGNGPDATGNNNDFGDPSLITSDVGCINANSVVIMPLGLMFQSRKGIYLLDQSLNVSYIGAPVESFNSYNITSAIQNPQDNQVIFTTSNGISLVYDYHFQQWSTWTNQMAQDAGIYNNLFCFITSDGHVWVQNRNKFTDGSTPVYLSFTLPNLAFSGLNGFQRVFRAFILGTYKGPHTLNVSVAYDYQDTFTQTATMTPQSQSTWGSDALWGSGPFWGGSYQIYQFRVDFSTQKCTAIRLKVSDNQTSTYNEGYAISSIVFEVGALPGGNRLPASNVSGAQ